MRRYELYRQVQYSYHLSIQQYIIVRHLYDESIGGLRTYTAVAVSLVNGRGVVCTSSFNRWLGFQLCSRDLEDLAPEST